MILFNINYFHKKIFIYLSDFIFINNFVKKKVIFFYDN